MDPIKILPAEIIEQILLYLDVKDLSSCCSVSQKWNIAANSNTVWKKLCFKYDWRICGEFNDRTNGLKFFSLEERVIYRNMGEWKKNFVLNMRVQNNWRTGNAKTLIIKPNSCDCNDDDISTVYSDGERIIAVGFNEGMVKLFDLKNDCKLVAIKDCLITSPISHIKIVNDMLIVLQKNLLQVYKFDIELNLVLYNIKLIKDTLVDSVDIPKFMSLERNYRTILLDDDDSSVVKIVHLTNNHMVFAPRHPHIVNVYTLDFDKSQPDNLFTLSTDATCFVFNIHVKGDVFYVLMGEHSTIVMMIQAYSLKSKDLLFSHDIVEYDYRVASRVNTMESNEHYLLVKFEYNMFILLERNTGRLLLEESGIIFLNANSNPKLIGILLDDSFQLVDPSTDNVVYCLTLEGLPLALHANVIVTLSIEYDKDCIAAGEVEFWNMHNTSQEIDRIKFPKMSDVTLIHKDETKLIFYASQHSCLVRNFMN